MIVPWVFYMSYDKQYDKLTFQRSKDSRTKTYALVKDALVADEKSLFIHRYDCKKIAFFASLEQQAFSTVFRLKAFGKPNYLRAHAFCHKTQEGFSCLLVDEYDLIKLKTLSSYHHDDKIDFHDQTIESIEDEVIVDNYKTSVEKILKNTSN